MLDLVMKHAPRVIPFIRRLQYRGGGILPSELLALIAICHDQDIERVIESGRHKGYSTAGLASWHWDVHSTDIAPITEVDRDLARDFTLTLSLSDQDAGSFLSNKFPSCARSLVFLDGPKGKPAVKLLQQYAPQLVCGAIHDMSRMCDDGTDNPTPNSSRAAAESSDLPVFFTDDPEYTAKYGHLDEIVWRNEYKSREDLTKHGFTLAIVRGGLWRA